MDLFRMKCFISVARHRNMAAAARELFITRPAMTAQMNALESELGCQLLVRSRQGVQLTEAGRQVLATFEEVVPQLDGLGEAARRLNAHLAANLSVGFHGQAEWMHLYELVNAFARQTLTTSVTAVTDPWNRLVEDVADCSLDVAIVELSDVDAAAGLATMPLFEEGLCVVVRRDHPFALQSYVTFEQLAGEYIVMPDFAVSPQFFEKLKKAFAQAKVRLYETGQGNQREATIMLAAAGACVTVVPQSFAAPSEAVAYVPIVMDDCIVRMGAVWRKETDNAAVDSFLEECARWPWDSYVPRSYAQPRYAG